MLLWSVVGEQLLYISRVMNMPQTWHLIVMLCIYTKVFLMLFDSSCQSSLYGLFEGRDGGIEACVCSIHGRLRIFSTSWTIIAAVQKGVISPAPI